MVRIVKPVLLALVLAGCGGSTAEQESAQPAVLSTQNIPADMRGVQAKQLFGAKRGGSQQAARPLGGYAKGCVAGGVQLPETGPTWQAMRLSRNRNWGHPETIDFIKTLSAKAARQPGWN